MLEEKFTWDLLCYLLLTLGFCWHPLLAMGGNTSQDSSGFTAGAVAKPSGLSDFKWLKLQCIKGGSKDFWKWVVIEVRIVRLMGLSKNQSESACRIHQLLFSKEKKTAVWVYIIHRYTCLDSKCCSFNLRGTHRNAVLGFTLFTGVDYFHRVQNCLIMTLVGQRDSLNTLRCEWHACFPGCNGYWKGLLCLEYSQTIWRFVNRNLCKKEGKLMYINCLFARSTQSLVLFSLWGPIYRPIPPNGRW